MTDLQTHLKKIEEEVQLMKESITNKRYSTAIQSAINIQSDLTKIVNKIIKIRKSKNDTIL